MGLGQAEHIWGKHTDRQTDQQTDKQTERQTAVFVELLPQLKI